MTGEFKRIGPAADHAVYRSTMQGLQEDLLAFVEGPVSQFVRFPFTALDAIMGGMLAGELHYSGAFSGNGKTLFMLSLAREWTQKGVGVYYMGLETTPMTLFTQLTCVEAGLNSADVLTGRIWDQPRWEVRKSLLYQASLTLQQYPLYLAPAERINLATLRAHFEEAARMDASVLMVDHVDHLGTGDGRGLYEESVAVNNALKDFAEQSGMLVMASTQFNLEAVRGDPLDKYLPPREHYVKMGNHKRELATTMLGLYRPLRQDVSVDDLKAVRRREKEPHTLLEDWQMAVACMKHRKDGSKEGKRCVLSTEGFRVHDLAERDRYSTTHDGLRII